MKKLFKKMIIKYRLHSVSSYGSRVRVSKNCHFQGNINLGNNISIGEGAYFVSTRAAINIHSNVVLAPNVTIYTGDHPTHVIGKHIIDISDKDKNQLNEQFDLDVTIEEGCWIGTRAIILKGVTIGRGSVIGAGAIVTKSVPSYSVYVGVPQQRIFERFSEEEILRHESIIKGNMVR